MASDIKIEVKVKTDKATKGLKKTGDVGKKAGDKIEKSFKGGTSAIKVMQGIIGAKIISSAFNLASKAVSSFTGFISESIGLAQVQEDAINDLNIALRGLGKYSEEASQELQDYASSLQEVSIFGDEAILKTMALGSQMSGLAGQDLKDATKAAANMASALSIDLDSAMRMIAKSASDSGSGLKRYGVVVEKADDKSQQLKNAIEAVNTQFSGAARGKIDTYSGAIQQTSNTYGDMLEKIGAVITQNKAVIIIIQAVKDIYTDLTKVITDNSKAASDYITRAILGLIDGFQALVPYINTTASIFKYLELTISNSKNAIVLTFGAVLTVVSAAVEGLVRIVDGLVSALPDSLVPDGWKQGLNSAKKAMIDTTNTFASATADAAVNIKNNLSDIGTVFEDTIPQSAVDAVRNRLTAISDQIKKAGQKEIDFTKKKNENSKTLEGDDKKEVIIKEDKFQKELLAIKKKYAVLEEEDRILRNIASITQKDANFALMVEQLGIEHAAKIQAAINLDAGLSEVEIMRTKALIDLHAERLKNEKDAQAKTLKASKDAQAKELENQRLGNQATKDLDDKLKQSLIDNAFGLARTVGSTLTDHAKTSFLIQKALAVAQSTVAAFTASSMALATFPGPPYTVPVAAAAFKLGMINTAGIAATSLVQLSAGKYAQGGFIGGQSYNGDRLTAQVNSGEAVLNYQQQKNFMELANGGNNQDSNKIVDALKALGTKIENLNILIQVSDYELGRSVSRAMDNGLVLGGV